MTAPAYAMTPSPAQDETVTDLVALNRVLGLLAFVGAPIALGDFPGESAGDLDTAIAESDLWLYQGQDRAELVDEITRSLVKVKAEAATRWALEVATRTAAAKACRPEGKAGEYYGGKANEPHVHMYGKRFHLKLGEGQRFNIVADDGFRPVELRDARAALAGHPLRDRLNAAVDKALLECGESLDKY